MKIRKNGKVINLTESDLRRIVKRVISEEKRDKPKVGQTYTFENKRCTIEKVLEDNFGDYLILPATGCR